MFTGIIERTGRVQTLSQPEAGSAPVMAAITRLTVDAGPDYATRTGDSVAVNGCCLTVTRIAGDVLAFDVSRETLARTSLGRLQAGSEVNLERALKVGDRLGGHLVSGHVDGLGQVAEVQRRADGWAVAVRVPAVLARYCIGKGSICIDGVSLTINELEDGDSGALVRLMLIPTTVALTSLKDLRPGQDVNLEVDQIGKWLERLAMPWRDRV